MKFFAAAMLTMRGVTMEWIRTDNFARELDFGDMKVPKQRKRSSLVIAATHLASSETNEQLAKPRTLARAHTCRKVQKI